jgi:hypothetical protein
MHEWIWWDLMTQLIHSSPMYRPKGSFQDEKAQSHVLRSLGFLDLDHPAIELMWTPKDQLVKLKNEDKHRYSARIIAASKPAFDKKKMSRYWIEFWGKNYVTLALE